ncbi:DENN domain-containing protein 2D, partial [Ameca splendens]
IIHLTRPLDSWLEHVNFCTLFDCLTDEEVLQVFAAAVLERRIIFIAEELGTLSQVLHAVAALLYPFTWQHTFISIVPEILIDVVMAPTPYLLGVQKRLLDLVTDQSDTSRTRQTPVICRNTQMILQSWGGSEMDKKLSTGSWWTALWHGVETIISS